MMMGPASPRARVRAVAAAAGVALALAGCVDNASELQANAPASPSRISAREGVSPSGATVAFVTVEGAPADVVARFSEKTNAEAARREVSIADQKSAHYLVRGYLSASATDGGTAIGYVWDVFDKSRRRVRRAEDAIVVKGVAADPWSLVTDQALASLAARSADDLAAVLSNMPEAAGGPPAAAAIAANTGVSAPAGLPPGARAFR